MAFTSPDPNRKQEGGLQSLVKAEKLIQIALVLPASVLIGWLAGRALDHWLHQHWIYVAGLIFGSIAGLTEAVRQAVQSSKDLDRDDKGKQS
jgi:ATP synthase protein I